ncbi:aminotransferase class I/II-fold pyridoxal phosphate-dependent enzyme [Fibrella sp. HMF5335]|uniref:Aminotransferase class I/II-fold pyridoxal phosphate-dependent enzyme n=1 Tax=Fibrella rubiginis TaxID=2817060 RepID=A0A939K3Z2_9BACT|nr:GntG family PLP-dependent aldolase [Fibrella rubiginis]MBO0935636.1 aminotransferase class I/II-fold pyridoxal phosphate-dependent enzyme [Fibrella rubiginis]
MMIDLRSDTVTRPTPAMLAAMMAASIGDDVFGEDPSVNALEQKAAAMFGMEAALFCPSGTMTNQLAIRTHVRPGDEVICDQLSHIYLYEGGGIAVNALASVALLAGERGKLTPELIAPAINNPTDPHRPLSRLVSLENTVNKGGGCYYTIPEIAAIRQLCDERGLALHLDGARLFNALAETGDAPEAYGRLFDSISICLSKGLGCPVGSLLLGSAAFIAQAKRFRKLMGGGWRQAGFLAAAGIYALDHHVGRLKQDHARARRIGQIMAAQPDVHSVLPVDTNIVIIRLHEGITNTDYIANLKERGILAVAFGPQLVRFVTHLDLTDEHIEQFGQALAGQTVGAA